MACHHAGPGQLSGPVGRPARRGEAGRLARHARRIERRRRLSAAAHASRRDRVMQVVRGPAHLHTRSRVLSEGRRVDCESGVGGLVIARTGLTAGESPGDTRRRRALTWKSDPPYACPYGLARGAESLSASCFSTGLAEPRGSPPRGLGTDGWMMAVAALRQARTRG